MQVETERIQFLVLTVIHNECCVDVDVSLKDYSNLRELTAKTAEL